MMISKFDDYPIHQTNLPVAQTASSDRFTYDRFWYNGHAKDSSFYFGIGLCRYPNLGILDCGFSLVIDGRQYAFHGSRRVPQEPTETVVGPFDLQILEPMGRHRLVIGPNETGIECDLTFAPRTSVVLEKQQTMYNERHLVMDVTRLDQFGFWQGVIRYDGKELVVNGDTTFGIKDRSWGIRPVGEAYTGGAPIDSFQPTHFIWCPIHWENRCTLVGLFEDGTGHQWHTDQVILPTRAASFDDPAGAPPIHNPEMEVWDGKAGHQLTLQKGTRRASEAIIRMNDKSGEHLEISLQPKLLFRLKGIGYMHPEWGHGKWKGELAIAGESWACDDVDPLALENLHIQQVVVARCGDEVGYGVLEQMHIGPFEPYGLKDWFDGAP